MGFEEGQVGILHVGQHGRLDGVKEEESHTVNGQARPALQPQADSGHQLYGVLRRPWPAGHLKKNCRFLLMVNLPAPRRVPTP